MWVELVARICSFFQLFEGRKSFHSPMRMNKRPKESRNDIMTFLQFHETPLFVCWLVVLFSLFMHIVVIGAHEANRCIQDTKKGVFLGTIP